MSVRMTARVWALNDNELEGARLLTLLALADYANGDDQCWPSVPTIATKTRVSERQVQRSIQWLEARGYIKIVEKGNGRGRLTLYQLLLKGDICDIKGDTMSPFNEELTPVDSKKGDISNIKGDIGAPIQSHARREPILQPTTETERVANATPTPPVDTVAEKPKPKRRRRVTPKEPAKPKPPAIVVFEEIHHRRPKSTQEPSITTVVVDLELWRQVVQKWSNRGYNPLNIDGQLDWYKHPEKMNALNGGTNGNHHRNSQGNYQRPETTQYTMAEHLAHDAEQRAKGRPF